MSEEIKKDLYHELPKYYGGKDAEKKWQEYWADQGIYAFDTTSDKPVYSVDTPPPTVSGSLHVGHVFSYTQAEIIIRYKRMQGYNIFYPFGFDDNGLPTERLVEKELGISGGRIPREEFIAKCLEVAAKYETQFKELWQSLGFSTEWAQIYSSIDDRARRVSQRSFLDLYKKGYVVKKAMPTLYCPVCNTAVAQAETEDKEIPSQFVNLEFTVETGEKLIIATTRPELLPALVAVFVHPEDERYTHLIGKKIKPPMFDIEVLIRADEKVAKDKGTGAVMCCTFGDTTDIEWFHQHGLELRQIFDQYGRMNELACQYKGLKIKQAREQIKKDLEEKGFLKAKKDIVHPVNVHERCGNEMEFVVTEQWFIKILEYKDELIKIADDIQWRPAFMKERYVHWVKNLKWDWCISRQRYFGVPFPLWYCAKCGEVMLAEDKELPVNPLAHTPERACICGHREFIPESNVLDTWATSSVTPQINAKWGESDDRMKEIFPFSMRPQAHDIIRTWAFYTIVKSLYHHGKAPWSTVMISGHSKDPKGDKISKSKGNAGVTPQKLMEQFGADPVRYWAAGSRLGMDTIMSEEVMKDGQRLVTKLWNASKFAIMNLEGYTKGMSGSKNLIDEWILSRLHTVIETATKYMDEYEYGLALNVIQDFFWRDLCDNYIELSKGKIKEGNEKERIGSQETLYTVLLTTLKMFAPFIPHITEEIYQLYFKTFEKGVSLHTEQWPKEELFFTGNETVLTLGESVLKFVEMVRKAKSEAKLSLMHPIETLSYTIPAEVDAELKKVFPQIAYLLKITSIGEVTTADYSSKNEDGSMTITLKWGVLPPKASL